MGGGGSIPTLGLGNHPSGSRLPIPVTKFLSKELKLGGLAGPFSSLWFDWWRHNPIMTRPKKVEGEYCVISDMSFPDKASVNSGIPKSPFKLHLWTSLDLADIIVRHGKSCYMYKVDLAWAYRQLARCTCACQWAIIILSEILIGVKMWPTSRPLGRQKGMGLSTDPFGKGLSEYQNCDKENIKENHRLDIIQQWQISETENESLRNLVNSQEANLAKYRDKLRMISLQRRSNSTNSDGRIDLLPTSCDYETPASKYSGYPYSRMSLYKSEKQRHRSGSKEYADACTGPVQLVFRCASSQTESKVTSDKGVGTDEYQGISEDDVLKLQAKVNSFDDQVLKYDVRYLQLLNDHKQTTKLLENTTEQLNLHIKDREETQESCRNHMNQHEAKVKERDAEVHRIKKVNAELRKSLQSQSLEIKILNCDLTRAQLKMETGKDELVKTKEAVLKAKFEVKKLEETLTNERQNRVEASKKTDKTIMELKDSFKKLQSQINSLISDKSKTKEENDKLKKGKDRCEELYREALKKVMSTTESSSKLELRV